MSSRPIPTGILITIAFLALYSAGALWLGWTQRSWPTAVLGIVAAAASVGSAMLLRWSRYLVYALAAAYAGEWLYSVYASARVGYFALFSWSANIRGLAPGFLLMLAAVYCGYMAHRHFGASTTL
jgi:hypothetical protein